jgi:hypothetical protein
MAAVVVVDHLAAQAVQVMAAEATEIARVLE